MSWEGKGKNIVSPSPLFPPLAFFGGLLHEFLLLGLCALNLHTSLELFCEGGGVLTSR
jgi:hypothetical protein